MIDARDHCIVGEYLHAGQNTALASDPLSDGSQHLPNTVANIIVIGITWGMCN